MFKAIVMSDITTKRLPDSLNEVRVLSAGQAAELFGVSVATFRRQYWAGKTPPAFRVM
jgi:hypothetical protein